MLFEKLNKVCAGVMSIGAFFLLAIMVMTIANVLYRVFFGKVILGNYELTEMMIVITAGFAMAYTVMKGGNVTVKILYEFLKQGQKNVVDILVALTGIGIWGIIGYASVWTMWKKGFKEGQTELLDIPYLPLKWIWVSSIALIVLMFCVDLFKSLAKAHKQ